MTLFRFGFICVPDRGASTTNRIAGGLTKGWSRLEIDGFTVHTHPETPVHEQRSSAGSVVVIGEAFASPGTVTSVAGELLAAEADEAFFDSFDRLSGRFALVFQKGAVKRVLHDPIGSRSVYYPAGQMGFGSHAELVARAFGRPRSPDVKQILASEEYRSRTVKYLPGDLTVYEGVHGLAPNNYYDLDSGQTVRYWPRHPRRETNFDEFQSALDDHLGALASHLRGRHSPVLGVTGGIDTRTMIAAFKHFDLPFRGVTWLRPKGGADDEELALIERLTAAGGFEHTFLDLGRTDDQMRSLAGLAKRNAGRFGQPARTTAHLHKHFGGPRSTFVRGYGAEIIRGFYNLPAGSSGAARRQGGLSLRARIGRRLGRGEPRAVALNGSAPPELLAAYDSSMRLGEPGLEHTRLGLSAFEGFARRAHFDRGLEKFGFDLSDLFYWEQRMGMWGAAKHNEMDPGVRSMAGFNSRAVYEAAFGLEPRERLTKELLLRVIAGYDRELAEVPYV